MISGQGWPAHGVAIGITDELGTDQIMRMRAVMAANPGLMITTPAQNGMGRFVADWTTDDEVSGRAHHPELRTLLDKLTSEYGFQEP